MKSPSSAPPAGPHVCHARGCTTEIEPRLFMCPDHWKQVPPALRESITSAYRPGQQVDEQPSSQYVALACAAIDAVAHKESRQRRPGIRAFSKPVQLALFDLGAP